MLNEKLYIVLITDISDGEALIENGRAFVSKDLNEVRAKINELRDTYKYLQEESGYIYEGSEDYFTYFQDGFYGQNHVYVSTESIDL